MMDLATQRDSAATLGRCLDCWSRTDGESTCPSCGREQPNDAGIFEAIRPLVGRNRVAAEFYNGSNWPKFRFWERLFLRIVGGKASAPSKSSII